MAKRLRLTVDVNNDELRREIRSIAAQKGISYRLLVLKSLADSHPELRELIANEI